MIPAEAVEAAEEALRDAFDWGVDGFEEQAKRALEAAAPHMLAAAWEEGHGTGRNDPYSLDPNPYRPTL